LPGRQQSAAQSLHSRLLVIPWYLLIPHDEFTYAQSLYMQLFDFNCAHS
jgi:hypothetical protein